MIKLCSSSKQCDIVLQSRKGYYLDTFSPNGLPTYKRRSFDDNGNEVFSGLDTSDVLRLSKDSYITFIDGNEAVAHQGWMVQEIARNKERYIEATDEEGYSALIQKVMKLKVVALPRIQSSHGIGNVGSTYNMAVHPLKPSIIAEVEYRLNKHVSKQLEWNIDFEDGQNQAWIVFQLLDFSGNIVAEERINSLRVANVKIDSYMIEWLVEQGKQLFAKSEWTKQGTRQEKKPKKKGKR